MGADYRFLFQSLVWSSLEGENKAVKQLFDDEHFTPQLAGKILEYIKTEEAQKDVSEMLNRDYDMDFATIPQKGVKKLQLYKA